MNNQAQDFARKIWHFVARHVWSLSLSGLSAISFLHLASEIREGELGHFDRAVLGWLEGGRGQWDTAMLGLTRFGEFHYLATLCCLVTLALVLLGRRREALYQLACAVGSALGCSALKLIFQRVRPEVGAHYLLPLPDSFSFPSGHAMGSVSVVGGMVILAFAWPVKRAWRVLSLVVAVPLVLGVAASRVYFGVHYASDVVGGQLAGAAWVAAMTGWFYPRLLPAEAAVIQKVEGR